MSLFFAQFLLGSAGLVAIAAWPPSSGQMLLVPLDGSDANALLIGAAATGARVIGPGPLPRSLVVSGDRSRLVARFGPWRTLVLAPVAAGCTAQVVA